MAMRRLVVPLLALLVSSAGPATAQARTDDGPAAKRSTLGDAAQRAVAGLVDGVYGDEVAAAKSPEQRAAVARKLLRAAIDERSDGDGRYALFIAARSLAAVAGDLPLAWSALEEAGRAVEFDAPGAKVEVARQLT